MAVRAKTSAKARAPLALALLAGFGACATDHGAKWARYEAVMRDAGLMRSDYDPPDAPFVADDLIRNFEKVALHSEFPMENTAVARETPIPLDRWSGEVEWAMSGDGLRAEDFADMRRITRRATALTGLGIVSAPPGAAARHVHIRVLMLNAVERALMAGAMYDTPAATRNRFVIAWLEDEDWPCMAVGGEIPIGPDRGKRFEGIFIRDELRGLNRRSCIEEELIQTLGLYNDGDDVRPSMFNDDEEFALITRHDEFLLRILYDPRLRPGMTADQAMPVVARIVAGLDLAGDPAATRAAR
ncbi:MAG: hypothetical protein ACI9ZH_000363 [Paracoccaceae bacterium]|jgi:hypothetical protein